MSTGTPRTIRVLVAGWVIQDGSFPIASTGDVVDVVIEHSSSSGVPSLCDETRSAIARPAYGRSPVLPKDGRLLWLHLVNGDGWSGQWWNDAPVDGPVTLTGTFYAGLGDRCGIDQPSRVQGRITRMHLVYKRVQLMDNGWATVEGTDRLTEIDAVPDGNDWWPSDRTEDGDFIATGVLVELDLDDVPVPAKPFVAGSLAVQDDTIWVMHASDPILLRVDRAASTPTITRYLLPLTIEPTADVWTRRIHAFEGNLWITSEHDIHRCTMASGGELSVDRYTTDGSRASAVHEGRLYLLGSTRSHMVGDRRYGALRTYPDAEPVRMLDESARRIVSVDSRVDLVETRADRATSSDGTKWCVDRTNVLRRIDPDGTTTSIDLSGEIASGPVRWTTPDAFTDPANADVVAAITVDFSLIRREDATEM